MLLRSLLASTFTLILFSCASPERAPAFSVRDAEPTSDVVLARVNREPITFSEWYAAYEAMGGAKKYSEAAFLDAYIKLRIGVQKGRKLRLESHPKVTYARELAIYNKFLRVQYNKAQTSVSFSVWKRNYLNELKSLNHLWTDPQVNTVGINKLKGSVIIAQINSDTISVSEFKTIYREERKSYSDRYLLNKYIALKLINEIAAKGGWLDRVDRGFINVAEELALFNMVNRIEFGTNKIDKKKLIKKYRIERENSDVEIYSSSLSF